MKTLKFAGYSDDTFGEYGVTQYDYDNCANHAPIHCMVTSGENGLFVTGFYALHPYSGVWTIGISQLDEDIPIPEWPMRFSTDGSGYSPLLEIDVPDDFKLTWYSDKNQVE